MYSSNLFTNDLFKLWNNDEEEDLTWDSVRHGIRGNQTAIQNPSNSSTNNPTEQLLDEHKKYLRLLFAPPLLAYSAEYPGANSSHLDYNIQTATSIPSIKGPNGVPLSTTSSSTIASTSVSRRMAYMKMNTPLTQLKIDQLELIRNTGYSTIRPIGIDMTMEEADMEEARRFAASQAEQQYDDPSYIHTTENEQVMSNDSREEVDLDAEVVNADEEEENFEDFEDDDSEYLADELRIRIAGAESFEDEDEDSRIEPEEAGLRVRSRFGSANSLRLSQMRPILERVLQAPVHSNLVDEGFMADDVEYQNDHSTVDPSLHQMLIDSGTSLNTSITGRSMETGVTSYRREDGEDSDDMVIEE